MRPVVKAAIGAAGFAAASAVTGKLLVKRLRHRRLPGDELLDLPADVAHKSIPTPDGGTIHFVERGEGRPLVLLHGITLAARVWSPQLHGLAGTPSQPGFRVIACDLRGHGESTAGTDGYGLSVLGRDLATLLTELDLRDAIVAGHSMGGMTLMRFCADHEDIVHERVAGLVFVATAAAAPIHPLVLSRLTGVGAKIVERLDDGRPLPGRHTGGDDLALVMCRLAFGKRPSAAAIEVVRECIDAMDDDALGRSGVGLLDHDVRETLGHLRRPAEIVVGSRDLLTPVSAAKGIARLLPDAGFHVLPEAGHQLMQERPAELERIIRDLDRRLIAGQQAGDAISA